MHRLRDRNGSPARASPIPINNNREETLISTADATPASSNTRNDIKRIVVRKDKTNPRRLAYLTLVLFATPPTWPLLALGAVMVLAGVFLHGWAAGYLARAGYADREKLLTARGPYRHNRNPYYLAHIVMDLGFFIMAGLPWLWLIYIPVSYSVYRRWVMNEEPFLEKEFGDDYRKFKQDVPRWGFRLTPAQGRGHEQKFEWAMYLRNRELHRTVSHLIILAVFVAYMFFGNPFDTMSVLDRLTLIGAMAVWLCLHDIFLREGYQIRPLWLLLSIILLIALIVFLSTLPVWQFWEGTSAWFGLALGTLLGVVASVSSAPAFTRSTGKSTSNVFDRPLNHWYVIGLGLGLLSGTLGGVWLGLGIPLLMWSFGIAGVFPMKSLPQSYATTGILVVIFAISLVATLQRMLG
ncbi:MAG: methyltransferase family protein [Thiohalophilus sp.]